MNRILSPKKGEELLHSGISAESYCTEMYLLCQKVSHKGDAQVSQLAEKVSKLLIRKIAFNSQDYI
jgi:hypothetical protein